MAPWTHIHVLPIGLIFPCCMSAHLLNRAIGDLHEGDTLEDAWNSSRMRQLRKNMLSGKKSRFCEKCYQQEKFGQDSFRTSVNDGMKHHFPLVMETARNGSLKAMNLPYLDIRFSNLCNLKCRICVPELSSKWYEDAKAMNWIRSGRPKVNRATADLEVLWSQLEPYLPGLEKIQFAGGEPLLMEEHYRILDFLVEQEMFDTSLSYNTNFSFLNYKHYDLPGIWSQFSDVFIMASLDGSGERGEYMRKGLKWDRVIRNRERTLEECPNIRFRLNPTVSVMNIMHMPDFYRDWLERGFIEPDGLAMNILYEPKIYSIQGLPEKMKERVQKMYTEFIDGYLKELGDAGLPAIQQFQAVLGYMNDQNISTVRQFKKVTSKLDGLRNEDFATTFPELSGLMGKERNSES